MRSSNCAFLVVLLLLAVSACSSDSKDNTGGGLVDPDPGDGNEMITFSADIQPLLASSCSGSGCHIGSTTSGVSLGSHAAILSSRGLQYGGLIVLPGNSSGSPILDKLDSSPNFGSRMPLGGNPLSSTQRSVIATWIDEGAPNN